MDGKTAFDAFIASCERLRSLNEDVAKEAEKPVADVLRANADKGIAPDGSAWPEKSGGGKALAGAADDVTSSTKRNAILVKIGPPYVFHNYGAGGSSQTKDAKRARARHRKKAKESGVKSKFHAPKRQIIPAVDEPTPETISDVLKTAAAKVFDRTMKGNG